MVTIRLVLLFILFGFSTAKAQQYSYSAGSDFSNSQYQVHVSIGQVFKSFSTSPLILDEGLFSVLVELLVLETRNTDQEIRLYPNPVRDELVIEAPLDLGVSGEVEIYSYQGVLVESFAMTVPKIRMALGHLIAGSYLFRIRISGRTDYVQKIIKLN